MDTVLLAAGLLLAVVFALAGTAKLLDLSGSRRAVADFGVPARIARAAGLALPLVELVIAASLLFPASARWGAMAALILLLAFVVAIAFALSQDRSPDCHCFGQIHSAPAGGATLVRNSALAVLAGFVAWAGPAPAIDTWLADRSTDERLLLACGLVLGAGVAYSVYRQTRRRRAERAAGGRVWLSERSGLEIGSRAPGFELDLACGGRLSLDALERRGRPVLLLFSTMGCDGCSELYPRLSRWQQMLADRLTIAVISVDEPRAAQPLCQELGIADVMVADADLLHRWRAPGTPAGIVIGIDGTIASGAAVGRLMIEELIRIALRRDTESNRPGSERDREEKWHSQATSTG